MLKPNSSLVKVLYSCEVASRGNSVIAPMITTDTIITRPVLSFTMKTSPFIQESGMRQKDRISGNRNNGQRFSPSPRPCASVPLNC